MKCQVCGTEDLFAVLDGKCCNCGESIETGDTYLVNRLIDLSVKSHHESLTDSEMKEWVELEEHFEVKECDQCKGQGGKDFPSMLGYGSDFLRCKKCDGHGMLSLPEEYKVIMKELIDSQF